MMTQSEAADNAEATTADNTATTESLKFRLERYERQIPVEDQLIWTLLEENRRLGDAIRAVRDRERTAWKESEKIRRELYRREHAT